MIQALTEFADYVAEKQQAQRNQLRSVAPSYSGYASQSAATEHHAELDVLDTLNLADTSNQPRLRLLLLDTSEDAEVTLQQLAGVLQSRLLEGNGEALFDLGQEDNGETMDFSKEHWDVALDRIRRAASFLRAECRILLTRNVGGPEEAETKNEKTKGCMGTILLRQRPETTEDVIETRIAVVGNGSYPPLTLEPSRLIISPKSTQEKAPCSAFWSKAVLTMVGVKLE